MTTKYYRDADGKYLGAFIGDTGRVPEGAIEVPSAPNAATDVWSDGAWVSPRAVMIARVMLEAKTLRTKLFTVVDGLQASALATDNTSDATAIETYKAGLRNITLTDLTAATTEAQMRKAVSDAYKALTNAAPMSVKLAFAQAVQ